jgi:predicted nucleic acid-binding Zn ribbon protein
VGFDGIGDILRKLQARNPSLAKRIVESEALSRWESAVGSAIAKHTRAIRIQDAILWVEVDHPVWKTELHYRKRQILDLLNQVKPGSPAKGQPEVLKDILFLDGRPRRE